MRLYRFPWHPVKTSGQDVVPDKDVLAVISGGKDWGKEKSLSLGNSKDLVRQFSS